MCTLNACESVYIDGRTFDSLPVAQVHRLHLLITASTLRRPIIVFENVDVSAVGEGSPDSLDGLYLPGGLHVGSEFDSVAFKGVLIWSGAARCSD